MYLDPSGSALPENNCSLTPTMVEKLKIITYEDPEIGKIWFEYKCTTTVNRCRGKCKYCEHQCKSVVNTRTEKVKFKCVLMKNIFRIKVAEQISIRDKIRVDEQCKCVQK